MHEEIVQKYIAFIDQQPSAIGYFGKEIVAGAVKDLTLTDTNNPERQSGPLNILMRTLIAGGHEAAGVARPDFEKGEWVHTTVAKRRRGLFALVGWMAEEALDEGNLVAYNDAKVCLLEFARRLAEANPLNSLLDSPQALTSEPERVQLLGKQYFETMPDNCYVILGGSVSCRTFQNPSDFAAEMFEGILDKSRECPADFSPKAKSLIEYEKGQIERLQGGPEKAYGRYMDKIQEAEDFDQGNTLGCAYDRVGAVRCAMEAKLSYADQVAARQYPAALAVFIAHGQQNGISNIQDRLHILTSSENAGFRAIGLKLVGDIARATLNEEIGEIGI